MQTPRSSRWAATKRRDSAGDLNQMVPFAPLAQNQELPRDRVFSSNRLRHIANTLVVQVDAAALYRAAGVSLAAGQIAFDQ